MKMGLGIWKFATLVLLFDLAFMEKVEGKRMNLLDFRQVRPNLTDDTENKLFYAYFDCARNWKPSVGQKCLHPDDVEIEYGDQLRTLPLDEAYLAAVKATRMICDAEPGANCTFGFCTCYDSSGSCTRHKQNLMKDCKKEFRAIWPFLLNTTQSNFISQSKTKLELRLVLWNSEVTDDEFEVTSILYDCAKYLEQKPGGPCMSNEFEIETALIGVRSLSLAEAYRKTKDIFQERCNVDWGYICHKGICQCAGTLCSETRESWYMYRTNNCVKELRAYLDFFKRQNSTQQSTESTHNSVFGPRLRFEYMFWTSLLFIVVVNLY